MDKCFLVPCHHSWVLEIPEVSEKLYMFGDTQQQRADSVDTLVRRGRFVPYIANNVYVLYDQETWKGLVSLLNWPVGPEWVGAQDPIDAVGNYIKETTDENELEYRAEGITVRYEGHRKAAQAIFTQMARARYGDDALVKCLQYLGYESGYHGFTFHYRALMGGPYGNGGMKGHYDFIHMNLMPKEKKSEA